MSSSVERGRLVRISSKNRDLDRLGYQVKSSGDDLTHFNYTLTKYKYYTGYTQPDFKTKKVTVI